MKHSIVLASLLFAVGAVGAGAHSAPLLADVLTVTNLDDSGPGSLRHTITHAEDGDEVLFAVEGTILLTSGELFIDKDLSIFGPLTASVVVRRDPTGFGRILTIESATVTIRRLSIENGHVFCCLDGEFGGGIYNGGVLRLFAVTLRDNIAPIGGAVYNEKDAQLDIVNSTLSGNIASDPGFGCDGGGFGGGIGNDGGRVTLRNTTISDNEGPCGGGIYQSAGRVRLVNTIVDEGRFFSPSCDIEGGALESSGYNMDSDGSCGLDHPRDQASSDPLLGSLADNGGPTLTHALLAGSPAIDRGTLAAAPLEDQRGIPRPQGPKIDIGAFELEQ